MGTKQDTLREMDYVLIPLLMGIIVSWCIYVLFILNTLNLYPLLLHLNKILIYVDFAVSQYRFLEKLSTPHV